MRLLIQWLVSAIAIMLSTYLLPGVHVADFITALVVSLVLGILNVLVKPLLFWLTLPLTIFTLGIFTLVLNAFIVLLVSMLVKGFFVDGFWWAFLFSIVLSFLTTFLNTFVD